MTTKKSPCVNDKLVTINPMHYKIETKCFSLNSNALGPSHKIYVSRSGAVFIITLCAKGGHNLKRKTLSDKKKGI